MADAVQNSRWRKQSRRVIVHCDLDCFYVQVERKFQPHLMDRPVAVGQYTSSETVIALSYEAKAMGVKRGMNGTEARRVCPEIAICQVPSLHEKADLTRYREAGSEVFEICDTFGAGCERTSIDEAYLDITDSAQALLASPPAERRKRFEAGSAPKTYVLHLREAINSEDWLLRVLMDDSWPTSSSTAPEARADTAGALDTALQMPSLADFDVPCSAVSPIPVESGDAYANLRLMAAGSVICAEMRNKVKAQTGFTLSAGIASNRMLSKLVSGMNKPNKQTMVVPIAAMELLRTLPLRTLNGFGGKLGKRLIENEGIKVLGDLRAFPTTQSLFQLAGGNVNIAQWMWDACRGIDLKPVETRLMSKSIGCGKTFPGSGSLRKASQLVRYFGCLCEELTSRQFEMWRRFGHAPSLITVHVSMSDSTGRRGDRRSRSSTSKAGPISILNFMPPRGDEVKGSSAPSPSQLQADFGKKLQSYLLRRVLAIIKPAFGRTLPTPTTSNASDKPEDINIASSDDFVLDKPATLLSVTMSKFSAGVKAKNRIDKFVSRGAPSLNRIKPPAPVAKPKSKLETLWAAKSQQDPTPPKSASKSNPTQKKQAAAASGGSWVSPERGDNIDEAILAELPPDIRAELRQRSTSASKLKSEKAGRGLDKWLHKSSTTAGETAGVAERAVGKCNASPSKKKRPHNAIASFFQPRRKQNKTSAPPLASAKPSLPRNVQWKDVDSAVFLQLPKSIQDEIRSSMRR